MLKQKKYDWQDTNMALFGSDIEKNIKKASAESEDQWKGVGQKKELRIWRIDVSSFWLHYGQFWAKKKCHGGGGGNGLRVSTDELCGWVCGLAAL